VRSQAPCAVVSAAMRALTMPAASSGVVRFRSYNVLPYQINMSLLRLEQLRQVQIPRAKPKRLPGSRTLDVELYGNHFLQGSDLGKCIEGNLLKFLKTARLYSSGKCIEIAL
jgi:hypothetical protein